MITRKIIGSVTLFFVVLMFCHCHTEEKFTICGTRCVSATPWTVESLDGGLPCFSTQSDCAKWAITHGYSGKPCVKCD